MNITLTITKEITDQRVKDLLCSAFEGGSNYWIDNVSNIPTKEVREAAGAEYYHECPVVGLSFLVESEMGSHILDKAALERGMNIFAAKYPKHFDDFEKENDDAITADVFLQCCIFGEVTFG